MPSGVVSAEYLNLPDLQLRRVVAGDVLHGVEGAGAGNLDLAHVRDVEQTGCGPHGHVLGRDAGVLHRHVPSAEGHHPGAQGDVGGVQGCLLEGSGGRVGHV